MSDAPVVTELIVDARGAVQGTAQYEASLQVAQRAVDRFAAAQQKQAAADKAAGAAAGETGQRIEQSGRSFTYAEKQLATYLGRLDPLILAQHRLAGEANQVEAALRTLDRQVMTGAVSVDQYNTRSAMLSSRMAQVTQAANQLTNGTISIATAMTHMSTVTEQNAADLDALTRRQEQLAASAQKYKDALNPLLPLQRAYREELNTINEVAGAGLLTEQQRIASIQRTKDAFAGQVVALRATTVETEAHAASTDKAVASERQMRASLINLGQQAQDVVVSLQGGQAPMTVLLQQGSQIATVFAATPGGAGAVLSAMGKSITSMISPVTIVAAGLVALGAGVLYLANRAADANQSINVFNVLLKGMGDGALANAIGLEATAKGLKDVGLAAADARQQIAAVGQAGLNPAAANQIIRTGADLSAYAGGNQTQALIAALSGGVESAVKFGLAVRGITVAQADNALEMARHGQAAQALDKILQSITEHAKGLDREALSPAAKAVRDMRVAWSEAMDSFSRSEPVRVVVAALTELAKVVSAIAKGMADIKAIGAGAAAGAVVGAAAGSVVPGVGSVAGGVAGAVVGGLSAASGSMPTGAEATIPGRSLAGVQPELQIAVRDMIAAAAQDGITLGIASGARSTERQAQLYAADIAKNGGVPSGMVAAPGHSQHEIGNAVDLSNASGGLVRAGSPEADWLSANASRFVSRPMSYEPWHVQSTGGATAGGVATAGTFAQATVEAHQYEEAQIRAAKATEDLGLKNAWAQAQAEAAGHTDLNATEQSNLATNLFIAAKIRLTNEINNENTVAKQELSGARDVAQAYAEGSQQGKVAEAQAKAQIAAIQKFGDVSTVESTNYREGLALQTVALEKFTEKTQNAKDLQAGKDTQAQLQLQINLTGQLPEIAQRELTMLQAKQQISKDFPFLTQQEKDNRLAMVQATADLNVKLAETQRFQSKIDDIFRSIGDTISSTLGTAIQNIFDGKKITDWGTTLKGIMSSVVSQVAQGLLIKPLIGSLLGALGASGTVTAQFGSLSSIFGGSSSAATSSGGLSTGTLLQGGGLFKDLFGGSSSSGGGLFSGVSSFIDNSIGSSLGFGTSGVSASSLGSLIGIEPATLAGIPGVASAGSLFGLTTLSSVLPFLGIGAGILGLLGSSLLGNKKPSNASSGATLDLSNFSVTSGFSGGNSQIDQQTQQVAEGVQQFLAMLKTTGGALSGSVLLQNGVNTGFTADSSLPQYSGRFNLGKDPTQALNVIELALSRSLTGISETMQTVINQISDPAAIEGAIKFATAYDNLKTASDDAFKSVEDAAKTTDGPFAQAMAQVQTTLQALTDQANQFGLSLGPINAALAEATTRLQGDFKDSLNKAFNAATGAGFINDIQGVWDSYLAQIKESQSVGLGLDQATQDQLGQVATAQINQILTGLDKTQLDEVITQFTGLNDIIVQLAQSAEGAAQATTDQAAATAALADAQQRANQILQATTQIQDYINQLNTTIGPTASPESALSAAQATFNQQLAAAQSGDINALLGITGNADTLIKDIEAYYGSSAAGQAMIDAVKQQLTGLETPTAVDQAAITNDLLTQQVAQTTDVNTNVVAASGSNIDALNTLATTNVDAANAAIAQNMIDAANLIKSNDDAASSTINANNVASAALIASNDKGAADAIAANNAASDALIATNTKSTDTIIAQNNAASAALVDANDRGAASIISQNQFSSDKLVSANNQGADSIVSQNQLSSDQLVSANDNATADLIAKADATTTSILEGASADATAIGLVVQNVGDEIVSALTGISGDSQVIAIYSAASSIIDADNIYANNQVSATFTSANSIIAAENVYADNQVSATFTSANSIISAAMTFANSQISATFIAVNNLIAAENVFADNTVSAIFTAANSLISVSATFADNQISATFDAANSIISTNLTFANDNLIALANLQNSSEVRLDQINLTLISIWNLTELEGDTAINQRNAMITLLQQLLDQMRLWGSAAAAPAPAPPPYYPPSYNTGGV